MQFLTPNPENLPQTRILLVDDQEDVLRVMHLVLKRRRNFQVETAGSGPQALEKMEQFAPHVVVSDLSMPGMDGCELMIRLRGKTDLTPFKAIALSGYGATHQEAALAAGYDVHLIKPVDFEDLFNAIERLAE